MFYLLSITQIFFDISLTFRLINFIFLTVINVAVQQTMWLFFKDMVKSIVLAVVIGPPIVSAMIVIVQVLTAAYFVFAWLVSFYYCLPPIL